MVLDDVVGATVVGELGTVVAVVAVVVVDVGGAGTSNSIVWQPAVTEVRMPSEMTPEPTEKPHPDDGEAEIVEHALPRCRGAMPRGPGTGRRVRCIVLEQLRRIVRQPQIVAAVDGLEHEDRSAAE